ncbi:hypothetical protein GRI89_08780 [Altererythrobacter salegens]|uniref:Phytoene synthase n=1 Tax=Croceibacterium salegens TaxID=1737568 RepID=A0A6I4SU80_9SPHN|nr:hypothetical protein [Croceibacterium salegens]MXO59634.1 hypothetical protein [Croceibacterium salegens]
MRNAHEPLLAQVRIAWWRDRLGEPPGNWPQGDPVLDQLRGWRSPEALVSLVDGWEGLVDEALDAGVIERFAAGRTAAFAALADELGVRDAAAAQAGRNWALADLAANLSDPAERERVIAMASREDADLPRQPELRPLAILGALGRRSIVRGGRPLLEGRGAALVAMRVGMFGR